MEFLLFLPLIVFKAIVMGGILWWVFRSPGEEQDEDGDGGLGVIGPRPPWRWVPRRRSPQGPHATPARRAARRASLRS